MRRYLCRLRELSSLMQCPSVLNRETRHGLYVVATLRVLILGYTVRMGQNDYLQLDRFSMFCFLASYAIRKSNWRGTIGQIAETAVVFRAILDRLLFDRTDAALQKRFLYCAQEVFSPNWLHEADVLGTEPIAVNSGFAGISRHEDDRQIGT